MAIKDILLHLDDSSAAVNRLDLAILYARKHGSHLRGFYPVTHEYFELRKTTEQSALERVEALFLEKTAAAGIASEWLFPDSAIVGASVSDLVSMQAYYSDLVIVGQTNTRSPNLNIPADLPEHLVKSCGRPVIVVPFAGSFATAGERILIAWKEGRESVRSLNDAMPHLEKAHYVSVVSISEEDTPPENDGHIKSVSTYLARHSVAVRTDQAFAESLSMGDIILNLTCERTADLLVIGSCARNYRGGVALSPVTQHVLNHLTVPILLSH